MIAKTGGGLSLSMIVLVCTLLHLDYHVLGSVKSILVFLNIILQEDLEFVSQLVVDVLAEKKKNPGCDPER